MASSHLGLARVALALITVLSGCADAGAPVTDAGIPANDHAAVDRQNSGRHGSPTPPENTPASSYSAIPRVTELSDDLPQLVEGLPDRVNRDNRVPPDGGCWSRTLFNQGDDAVTVLFDRGSAHITDAAEAVIEELAGQLRTFIEESGDAVRGIRITGHTDATPLRLSDGSDGNRALSRRRAAAVRDALVEHDIDASWLLRPRGRGSRELIDAGDEPASRARNRRVEIAVACGSTPDK